MIDLRRLLAGTIVATGALVVLLGIRPVPVPTILAGYVLVVAALLLTGLTGAINAGRRTAPSHFARLLRRERVPPSRPAELVRLERELTLAGSSAMHFRRRMRPLLVEIAEARLDGPLDEARIPARTWELLRPAVEPVVDRTAPGVPLRRLREAVDDLERLG